MALQRMNKWCTAQHAPKISVGDVVIIRHWPVARVIQRIVCAACDHRLAKVRSIHYIDSVVPAVFLP